MEKISDKTWKNVLRLSLIKSISSEKDMDYYIEMVWDEDLEMWVEVFYVFQEDLMMWVPLEEEEEENEPLERNSIQVVQISQEDVAQNLDCAICLVDFVVDEDARELNCGGQHKFHQVCLFTWLENRRSCPKCREPLNYDNQQDWTDD